MRTWGKTAGPWLRQLAVGALAATLGLVGCKKPAAPSTQADTPSTTQTASTTQPAGSEGAPPPPVARDPLHQSFADAVRDGNDPPPGEERPPDKLMTGTPTYKIFEEVKKSWDTIRFTDSNGTPIHYTAILQTDFGDIEIELKPEGAPNHVRNFIALARAGYYDGLLFDRIKHEKAAVDGKEIHFLDAVEAGCPVGEGEVASGSIGYWLKPEFKETEKHVRGAVGACRGYEQDSAATRFYIILNESPQLDGNDTVFGKVKPGGLDVVDRIATQPTIVDESVKNSEEGDGRLKPANKIVIKKVTIKAETGTQS